MSQLFSSVRLSSCAGAPRPVIPPKTPREPGKRLLARGIDHGSLGLITSQLETGAHSQVSRRLGFDFVCAL